MFVKSSYVTYLYAFILLFGFGIGLGFVRSNFNKVNQDKEVADKSVNLIKGNQAILEKEKIAIVKSQPINKFSKKTSDLTLKVKEIKTASPSLDQLKYLISTWLDSKSKFLEGNNQIDLSKIVQKDLISRLYKERENDIQKGIYKNINTEIESIQIQSQTASRIVVNVNLIYSEKIIKTTGELVNETSFQPFLKVKYILGFSNSSWKLVDYISGV